MFARFVLCFLCFFARPLHAEWIVNGPENILDQSALVCGTTPNGEVCLELGCDSGGELQFAMNALYHSRMSEANLIETNLYVGKRMIPVIDLENAGDHGIFRGQLEQYHLDGLKLLKAGRRANARFWMGANLQGDKGDFSLKGSGKAIDAVMAACPLPDFKARDLAQRTVDDPLAHVRSEYTAECNRMGGQIAAVQEHVMTSLDADGETPMDIVIDHGAMICSTSPSHYCGSAGCLTSLWIGQENGRFTRVFSGNTYGISADGSGVVTMAFHGGACGLAGAAPCKKSYSVFADRLEPVQ